MSNSADRTIARLFTSRAQSSIEAGAIVAVLELLSAGSLVGSNAAYVQECLDAVATHCTPNAFTTAMQQALCAAKTAQAQGR